MPTKHFFRQLSSFGPYVECKREDEGAIEFVPAPSHAASTEPASNFTATQAAQLTEQDAPAESIECWSHNEEDFNCSSLGELLDNHGDEMEPGATVWVGEAVRPAPRNLINMDCIIENLGEAAYDIAGEYAEGYPDVSKEHVDELEAMIAAWIAKRCPPTFYTVTNAKPYVLSHEDFPGNPEPVEAAAILASQSEKG